MDVRRFGDLEEMSRAAFILVRAAAETAIQKNGRFSLCLSGGSTPRRLYERLAASAGMPWSRVHLFWGDERAVPPDSEHSNYGLARRSLLSGISIPEENVHRIRGEAASPNREAARYEEDLGRFFGASPAFDLTLLGLGPDGHTASIFPDGPVVNETKRFVAAVPPPEKLKPAVPRLTLTLPALNASKDVLFLAAAKGKEAVIRRITDDPAAAARDYPAAMVRPAGRLVWYIAEKGMTPR